jgi:hypothetical protein
MCRTPSWGLTSPRSERPERYPICPLPGLSPGPDELLEAFALFEEPTEEGSEAFPRAFLSGQRIVDRFLDGDVPGWHVYACTYVVIQLSHPCEGSRFVRVREPFSGLGIVVRTRTPEVDGQPNQPGGRRPFPVNRPTVPPRTAPRSGAP